MLNGDEIRKIAVLSKLNISDEILFSYKKDIEAVLNFAEANSKFAGIGSGKDYLSISKLRDDEGIHTGDIAPSEISQHSDGGFYKVGEENSHDT